MPDLSTANTHIAVLFSAFNSVYIILFVAYRLYTVVPRLVKFVEDLTNWYIRMNRKRLKGDTETADCKAALETLFIVIYSMVKVMVRTCRALTFVT